jgi:hypothetical protein
MLVLMPRLVALVSLESDCLGSSQSEIKEDVAKRDVSRTMKTGRVFRPAGRQRPPLSPEGITLVAPIAEEEATSFVASFPPEISHKKGKAEETSLIVSLLRRAHFQHFSLTSPLLRRPSSHGASSNHRLSTKPPNACSVHLGWPSISIVLISLVYISSGFFPLPYVLISDLSWPD